MSNKMLIDAAHPEETRVVLTRGNKVEEFDFESASRRPLRGNIYLAKVTRVEPSLQAAFIEYGGNRHGFLAFSEIHPDYYQIPHADRQALVEEEQREQREAQAAEEAMDAKPRRRRRPPKKADADAGSSDESVDAAAQDDDAPTAQCPRQRGGRRGGLRDRRGRRNGGRRRRHGGARRRGRDGGGAGAQAAPCPPVQDPGGHQASPDPARSGRQGGARQQGRRHDDLSQPCRPLLRADAEHGAGRRHKPQDHQRIRPQAPQVRGRGPRSAAGHGPHRAHGRREPDQDGGQAGLRVPAAPVGERARPHLEEPRPRPRLRGGRPHQARHPRSLHARCRRGPGRGRARLSRGQGLHAHAHAEPCQERSGLQGASAALRQARS